MEALLDAEAQAIAHFESTGDSRALDAVHSKIADEMRRTDDAVFKRTRDEPDELWEVLCKRVKETVRDARRDTVYRARNATALEKIDGEAETRSARVMKALALAVDMEDEQQDEEDLELWDGKTEQPPILNAASLQLKDHQEDGVQFVLARFAQRKGAILAFAMGLGKTLTALAVVERASEEKRLRVIIVCPSIVAPAWKAEHTKFASHLHTHMYDPLCSTREAQEVVPVWLKMGGVLVLSFDLMLALGKADKLYRLVCESTDLLIMDEIHELKNLKSQRTAAMMSFKTPLRLGLTGTPLQNSPMDYFSIVHIVDGSALGISIGEFTRIFDTPIRAAQFQDASDDVKKRGREQTAVLRSLMHDVVLHKSSNVLLQLLPPKREYMVVYDYDESLASKLASSVAGERGSYLSAQARVDVALRQIKVELVDDMLADMGEGEAAIVFSEHPHTLGALMDKLSGRARVIHGNVSGHSRQRILEQFEAGEFDVLLLTLGTGSTGINCQRASRVIIMDPSENPTRDAQAVCRAYRIGQTRPVTVYRLAARDTVDMRVMQRGVVKMNMAHNLLNMQHTDSGVSRKDLSTDTLSVDLADASACDDAVVRAVAHRVRGWTLYDSFFTDTENDTTDEAAALNNYHKELNKRVRYHTFADGTKVAIDEESALVRSEDGQVALVAPPIPVVNCKVDRTIVSLGPKCFKDVKYEVAFRRLGSAWKDSGEVIEAHKFVKMCSSSDQAKETMIQCRSRYRNGDSVGEWSAPSAPFVDRM